MSEFFDARWLEYDITKVVGQRDIPGAGPTVVGEVYWNQDVAVPFAFTNATAEYTTQESTAWFSSRELLKDVAINGKVFGTNVWKSSAMTPVIGTKAPATLSQECMPSMIQAILSDQTLQLV